MLESQRLNLIGQTNRSGGNILEESNIQELDDEQESVKSKHIKDIISDGAADRRNNMLFQVQNQMH